MKESITYVQNDVTVICKLSNEKKTPQSFDRHDHEMKDLAISGSLWHMRRVQTNGTYGNLFACSEISKLFRRLIFIITSYVLLRGCHSSSSVVAVVFRLTELSESHPNACDKYTSDIISILADSSKSKFNIMAIKNGPKYRLSNSVLSFIWESSARTVHFWLNRTLSDRRRLRPRRITYETIAIYSQSECFCAHNDDIFILPA